MRKMLRLIVPGLTVLLLSACVPVFGQTSDDLALPMTENLVFPDDAAKEQAQDLFDAKRSEAKIQPSVKPDDITILQPSEQLLDTLPKSVTGLIRQKNHRLLMSSEDGQAVYWTVESPESTAIMKRFPFQRQQILGLDVARGNDRMLMFTGSQELLLWNVQNSEIEKRITPVPRDGFTAAALNTDGKLIVTGSVLGTCTIYNADSGESIRSFPAHEKQIHAVAFSPSGRSVICASEDNTVSIWNLAGIAVNDRPTVAVVSRPVPMSSPPAERERPATVDESRPSTVFRGHKTPVVALAASANGQYIASGEKDGTIYVWEPATGKVVFEKKVYSNPVRVLVFSSDGRMLVSVEKDSKTLILWDIATQGEIRRYDRVGAPITAAAFIRDDSIIAIGRADGKVSLLSHFVKLIRKGEFAAAERNKQIQSLPVLKRMWRKDDNNNGLSPAGAFSNDGTQWISGALTGTIRFYDTKTGDSLRTLYFSGGCRSIAANPVEARMLAAVDGQNVIYEWSTENYQKTRAFLWHNQQVSALDYSRDGELAVSGSFDKTAVLWNAKTGEFLKRLIGHTDSVTAVAISHDKKRVATASSDQSAAVWNVETGEPVAVFVVPGEVREFSAVTFSPDGTKLAFCGGIDNPSVTVWDIASGDAVCEVGGYGVPISTCRFAADGRLFYTGDVAGNVVVWNTELKQPIYRLNENQGSVFGVCFDREMKFAAVMAGEQPTIWDISALNPDMKTGKLLREFSGHNALSARAIVLPGQDGNPDQVAGTGWSTLTFWNIDTGERLDQVHFGAGLGAVDYTPDGKRMILSLSDGRVPLIDTATRRITRVLEGHTGTVHVARFSADGKLAMSSAADKTAIIWDVARGVPKLTLKGHKEDVSVVQFSPDGSRILTCGPGAVLLWDAETGSVLYELVGHTHDRIWYAAFSPKGDVIASGSDDAEVIIWNAENGEIVKRLKQFNNGVFAIAFNRDGSYMAATEWGGRTTLWDTSTWTTVCEFPASGAWCCQINFTPDGKKLITSGGLTQKYQLWEVPEQFWPKAE